MLLLYLVQNEHRGGKEWRSESSIKCGEKATGTTEPDPVCFGHWEIWYHRRTSVRQTWELNVRSGLFHWRNESLIAEKKWWMKDSSVILVEVREQDKEKKAGEAVEKKPKQTMLSGQKGVLYRVNEWFHSKSYSFQTGVWICLPFSKWLQ